MLNGNETVVSKNKFERFMSDNGHDVKHYRIDNGIFTKQCLMEEINRDSQTITCCGLNTYHQNSHAERAIRTFITSGQVMMLHDILH